MLLFSLHSTKTATGAEPYSRGCNTPTEWLWAPNVIPCHSRCNYYVVLLIYTARGITWHQTLVALFLLSRLLTQSMTQDSIGTTACYNEHSGTSMLGCRHLRSQSSGAGCCHPSVRAHRCSSAGCRHWSLYGSYAIHEVIIIIIIIILLYWTFEQTTTVYIRMWDI